ncbi:MAG TPA: LL-diaminopimelate aminotransferase [Oligoflexia bacterium]|nr:LL-diaminopimelate aminotransferase [Oligoflexia bacterium]HMP48601.1 LL-diaminopimelate aminotransferase [Oligoflexia bacterium]
MANLNESFLNLKASYLFSDIAKRLKQFQSDNPDKKIIRLGIGDVTLPLPAVCRSALHKATDELGARETFRGYGPEQGYDFLREVIAKNDYQDLGVNVSPDEIFVSDGSKCDSGNFQELFAADSRVGIPDPVYPVYLDSNVMAGRGTVFEDGRYHGVHYLETGPSTGFLPVPPERVLDVVYLCSPNNPTGAVFTRSELVAWVEYAKKHKSVLLFDAAYSAFIYEPDSDGSELPRSIFEVPGAREVAVEFRSFSKNAGFTGTRCAFVVIPKECMVYDKRGGAHSLHALWFRRQSTKFNGVSYPVQRAAEAIYSEEGKKETSELVKYYLNNAKNIRTSLQEMGYSCTGGINSPYVWVDAREDSWKFFDRLLNQAGVVCTPGAGFGKCGEGYVRFSSFNLAEQVEEALQRIKDLGQIG